MVISKFVRWVKDLMADNGTPSSSRVLMYIFAFFSMSMIRGMLNHMYYMEDPARLGMWLNAFPFVIFALCTLIILPYTINRGGNAISDLAGMVAQLKTGGGIIGNIQTKVLTAGNGQASSASVKTSDNGNGGDVGGGGPKG